MVQLYDQDAEVVADLLTRVAAMFDGFNGPGNFPRENPAYEALVALSPEKRKAESARFRSIAAEIGRQRATQR